jgi:hypothetical protein
VIVLRYFEDLTEVDTAAAMDCTMVTADSQRIGKPAGPMGAVCAALRYQIGT